ncbi:heme-binding protein [Saccharothrix sp. NRRL B-16314]|uniref:heme-binding protein n=1 Tax=Saccharothrix sp. NRRL B-16314 TaxID=1463825 RepID=UPI00052611D1|nr:heme-binding protein [Saccharothrix sp. NRRL B-16314]
MPREALVTELTSFQQQLMGTWTNQNLPGTDKGDITNPYSYNVMPLPQQSPQKDVSLGYILKNFTYYETIVFRGQKSLEDKDEVLLPVAAPNRGSTFQQTPFVVFYDQQIRFAEGPGRVKLDQPGQVVHEENGAWLYLKTEKQQIGPYPYPIGNPLLEPGDPDPQPSTQTLCKQISVPHGVSVVALGFFAAGSGEPTIPAALSVLPMPEGLDTLPYPYGLELTDDDNYQNPQPLLTLDITLPIKAAIADLRNAGNPVTDFIYCQVDDTNGGAVVDIPFEQQRAATKGYSAVYWLMSIDGGANYDILAYTQRILIDIEINSTHYTFPHPTSNVVTRVKA